jgi:hypothetical protein
VRELLADRISNGELGMQRIALLAKKPISTDQSRNQNA